MATAKKAAPVKKAAKAGNISKNFSAAKLPASKNGLATKKSATKAPAKKAPAKKAPAKKAPAKKAPAKKAPAKKAPAKKVAPKKVAPKKVVPAKKVAPVKPAKPVKAVKPAKVAKVVVPKVVVPVVPPVQVINPIGGMPIPAVRKAVPGKKAAPKRPVVEEDESKWTKTELNVIRKNLTKEAAELEKEIAEEEERFRSLIMESGEGAGDDQADAGAKTFEREHEISILSNKKDLLDQSNHALERIEAGTYGFCETCGKPIGKLRLMEANPRATLCMPCREREDRS